MSDQYARLDRIDESKQKAQADRLMFRVTLASTLVAVFAAGAAFWSSLEAHKLRVEDQRPFITVDFEPPTKGTTPNVLPNNVWNTGKSPAKNVKITCETGFDSEQKVIYPSDAEPDSFPFLFPGHWVRPKCPLSRTDYNPAPNATIVNLGAVSYEDIEGRKYESPFCYQWLYTPNQQIDVHQCGAQRGLPIVK